MNCPKCGTPAQGGVQYCKRCGTPLAAKAKTAAQAESSSSDEIDLMPLEEKKPAYSAYEPPPGLDGGVPPAGGAAPSGAPGLGGPPSPDAPVKKIRGAMAAPKKSPVTAIVGGAIGVIVLLWVGWLVFRTKNEVKVGDAKFERVLAVPANGTIVKNIEVTGIIHYTLDVEVLDGEVLAGVVKRGHREPTTLAAIKQLGEPLQTMKKGEKSPFTGDFNHKEQWSWILANETKKGARVKVKFVAQP